MSNAKTSETVVATPKPERDTEGLIVGVDYARTANGFIDWRKMVKPEFLVPNEQKLPAEQRGKNVDIKTLQDNQLLILLGGIKDLANLRGFQSVEFRVNQASRDYVCVTCEIYWVPNFETENRIIRYTALADAHADNTDPNIGYNFLACTAENRAFVRCVKNFLRINILGKDEIALNKDSYESGSVETASTALSERDILSELMIKKDVSFDRIQVRLAKLGDPEAANYNSIEEIPIPKVYELISLLKNYNKA